MPINWLICCASHTLAAGRRNAEEWPNSQAKLFYTPAFDPGVLSPLYGDCAMNRLLADKMTDNPLPFDAHVNFSSYDSMELSGLPFWNFIENLPSSILDPVDSMPTHCRQLQLIEELLSYPFSYDGKAIEAYNKDLAEELDLDYPLYI